MVLPVVVTHYATGTAVFVRFARFFKPKPLRRLSAISQYSPLTFSCTRNAKVAELDVWSGNL